MSSQVWLVTGASSGLGHEIALAALAAGHKVIGTARSKTKSAAAVDRLEKAGAAVIEFDASHDSAAIARVAHAAEAIHGRIDVLVNNAGYSLLGAVEDFSSAEAHLQFETNLFGPLFLTQALLPGMRARKAGTVVNVSSVAGLEGLPSCGLYAGTKMALEGMSESLSKEVSAFGIRILVVNPGAFRTNFLSAVVKNETGVSEAYHDSPVTQVLDLFDQYNGKQPGDPVKGGKIIVQTVDAGCTVNGERIFRLPLGVDGITRLENKLNSLVHDRDTTKALAESAAFPS